MATHSSILAWRIPWTEEPGGLQPTESQRVRHDGVTNTSVFFKLSFMDRYSFYNPKYSILEKRVHFDGRGLL